jgi:pimeloyl-ACP methyl ester carboxylesterase
MATFVLVHGAWHGGWCWKHVVPFLTAAGHSVWTPTLTGLGERAHLAGPEINLTTHLQDVVNLLRYEGLLDVILVGHSYGGMVITGVAEQVPERIAHLVYLDAFVPGHGQCVMDLTAAPTRDEWRARVQSEGVGWQLLSMRPGPWGPFLEETWRITEPAVRAWMGERLVPQPIQTMEEPLIVANPATGAIPRCYIRCMIPGGAGGPFANTAAKAKQPGSGWRYFELQTAHAAMVTMPSELAKLLIEIA